MTISDLLTMCMRNLIRRKFRTVLTVTGVVIGTCMIIVMVSLGEGIRQQNDEIFANMGDLTIIQVWPGWTGEQVPLTDESLAAISRIPGVSAVSPFDGVQLQAQLYAGRNERYRMSWMNLTGVYPEALPQFGFSVAEGRSIQPQAPGARRVELLFGSQVAYNFEDTRRRWPDNQVWPGQVDEFGHDIPPFVNPMQENMVLRMDDPWNNDTRSVDFDVSVVGILRGGGSGMQEWETRSAIFIDIRELRRMQEEFNRENNIRPDRNAPVPSYNNVRVRAETMRQVPEVEQQISDMGFQTFSMEARRQEAEAQVRQQQMTLGAIALITLLVAAISIANTMVMSVYERTREIGVMKVLGCLVSNIRTIFLIEAGLTGFFGGIVGIGLSYLASFIINNVIDFNMGGGMFGGGMFGGMGGMGGGAQASVITLWMPAVGLGFATIIGLVAGFYPAYRAVKISALEAIKQE